MNIYFELNVDNIRRSTTNVQLVTLIIVSIRLDPYDTRTQQLYCLNTYDAREHTKNFKKFKHKIKI